MFGLTPFSRRQLAARRIFLDGQGNPSADAKVFLSHFKKLCAGAPDRLLVTNGQGVLDPVATTARAARREVWDELMKLLNLDDYQQTNLRED